MMTLTPSLVLFWMCSVMFIVAKYKFIIISPETVSHAIFDSIEEAVVVIGLDGKFLWSNRKFKELTGLEYPDIDSFLALVEERDLLEQGLVSVRQGLIKSLAVRNRFNGSAPRSLLLEYHITRVLDEFGDFTGISVLAKVVKDISFLRDLYKISRREIEIIQAVFDGFSNQEIADSLNIAERTVKSHLTHIFMKLNVNNKIQLINLLLEYELVPKASAQKKLLNLTL